MLCALVWFLVFLGVWFALTLVLAWMHKGWLFVVISVSAIALAVMFAVPTLVALLLMQDRGAAHF